MSAGARLVLVADDYGYCQSRCEAIVQLYRLGAISTASVIVNSHYSRNGARLARQWGLPTGLHFNITEGRPTSKCDVSSLCDENGLFLGKFGLRQKIDEDLVNLEHVALELRSQIDLYEEWFGKVPSHVDGHQHVHVLPGVCDSFASVLVGKRVRWSRVPAETIPEHVTGSRRQFYHHVVRQANMAATVFTRHGIRSAPRFIGLSTMGRDLTLDRLAGLFPLTSLPIANHEPHSSVTSLPMANHERQSSGDVEDCVVEWMVHPGYLPKEDALVFGEGPDDFASSSDRKYEFDFLSSDHLKQFFLERNIQLCSFDQI